MSMENGMKDNPTPHMPEYEAPETIYLQADDCFGDEGRMWCADNVFDKSIEYVRKALPAPETVESLLGRVPDGLKAMTFYRKLDGGWTFSASDNRRTKNHLPRLNGEGATPLLAIKSALGKLTGGEA